MPRPDSVEAGAFYTNLAVNACTGCNYSSDNGYFVLGATNCFAPGSVQWIAFPFMASKTGIVKKALVSITDWGGCTSTAKQVTIGIYSDACTNTPGTLLGSSATANIPAAPCGLATANFRTTGASLTAGTWYWIVATTVSPTQDGTTGVWWMSNYAQAPYNLGSGWTAFPDGAPGGFQIQ